ncbi:Maleate isomerase (plasmid) [Pseudoseohaeicola sp. NH-UV-7]|uniref:maleate cis-trans isomerase family protein n=1 Tax=unclassified Sulfitobacter TaxID=196795 RepID=UPI000E0B8110|nr:aspartate/glutamate racemase family protein [Sulfitobacter sp. JL08]AXI54302.1 Asp/Glu racemase [Sulfitobacter sp. JL08]
MSRYPYTLDRDDPQKPPIGLIVLQTDETIEPDFKRYFADHPSPLYVSRIPSGQTVTHQTLSQMQTDLTAAADLLPKGLHFPVIGYGCTSASSVIGSERIEKLVQGACDVDTVTNPLRATVAACAARGLSRIALLSPYIEEVNEPLRAAFAQNGVDMSVFGSFGEAQEAKVVRISTASVVDAAVKLGADPSVEGVFLSCTNLRTYDAIPAIEQALGKPVLSSNQALAWHMRHLVQNCVK